MHGGVLFFFGGRGGRGWSIILHTFWVQVGTREDTRHGLAAWLGDILTFQPSWRLRKALLTIPKP